jgi:hypothetical protein
LIDAPRRQAMVFQRPVLLAPLGGRNVAHRAAARGVAALARSGASRRAGPVGLADLAARPRACCPAASSSGSRWRARGRSPRACCSSTSRPRASIPAATRAVETSSGISARHDDRDDDAHLGTGSAAPIA